MENYFIIHGSFGSSQENWFPWLEETLIKKGKQVFNLDYPCGGGNQNFKNWEYVLNSVRRFINEDSVFFCHSISCVFLAKYLIKNDLKVGKVVFVSGFNNYLGLNDDFDEVNCTMYTNRLSELKNHAKERICYYSDSDPFVKLSYLEDFAKVINAECHHVKNAGHFNHSAGYDKFEDLLKYIK